MDIVCSLQSLFFSFWKIKPREASPIYSALFVGMSFLTLSETSSGLMEEKAPRISIRQVIWICRLMLFVTMTMHYREVVTFVCKSNHKVVNFGKWFLCQFSPYTWIFRCASISCFQVVSELLSQWYFFQIFSLYIPSVSTVSSVSLFFMILVETRKT